MQGTVVETGRIWTMRCSRIAMEDGEVSPTDEWRTWSVVGSVLRYLFVASGGWNPSDKGGRIGCLVSRAACAGLPVCKAARGGIWGRTRDLGGAMERQNGEFARV